MSTVYVGMDVGSKVTAVAARSESGEVVERLSFKTSKENLISHISRYGMDAEVLLEEGELAGWVYRTLLAYTGEVIVCDPKRNAWIAVHLVRSCPTKRVDFITALLPHTCIYVGERG